MDRFARLKRAFRSKGWILVTAFAIMSATSCGPSVPVPFDYYPGVAYALLAEVAPDSAAAMQAELAETIMGFRGDFQSWRLVDPRSGDVIVALERVQMYATSTRFETGEAHVFPLSTVRSPDERLAQARTILAALERSGWRCEGIEVAREEIESGKYSRAADRRWTDVNRNDLKVRCPSPAGAPATELQLSLKNGDWLIFLSAEGKDRCRYMPEYLWPAYCPEYQDEPSTKIRP